MIVGYKNGVIRETPTKDRIVIDIGYTEVREKVYLSGKGIELSRETCDPPFVYVWNILQKFRWTQRAHLEYDEPLTLSNGCTFEVVRKDRRFEFLLKNPNGNVICSLLDPECHFQLGDCGSYIYYLENESFLLINTGDVESVVAVIMSPPLGKWTPFKHFLVDGACHEQIFTWLLICKRIPMIDTNINKDISEMICSYICSAPT